MRQRQRRRHAYRSPTNDTTERFNRTFLAGWAYAMARYSHDARLPTLTQHPSDRDTGSPHPLNRVRDRQTARKEPYDPITGHSRWLIDHHIARLRDSADFRTQLPA